MHTKRKYGLGIFSILVSIVVFLVPFSFIILTSMKGRQEASLLEFTWPSSFHFWGNLVEAVSASNFMLVTAFINSTIISVASVAILVILSVGLVALISWGAFKEEARNG